MNPNDHEFESMLSQAFDGRRHASSAHPSLGDVRRRARRRQRRTVGGITVAAAVVGVGGVGAIALRAPGGSTATGTPDGTVDCGQATTTLAPIDGSWVGAASTTATVLMEPAASTSVFPPDDVGSHGSVLPEASTTDSTVFMEPGASTSLFPPTSTTVVGEGGADPQVTVSTVEWPGDVLVTEAGPLVEGTMPCIPGAPVDLLEPTTTSVAVGRVLLVDASGTDGAVDDALRALGALPDGIEVTVVGGTRIVEQTMVMPIADWMDLAAYVGEALSVDGFDTWTPDLVGPDLATEGFVMAVVVGADWAQRPPTTNTIPATTSIL